MKYKAVDALTIRPAITSLDTNSLRTIIAQSRGDVFLQRLTEYEAVVFSTLKTLTAELNSYADEERIPNRLVTKYAGVKAMMVLLADVKGLYEDSKKSSGQNGDSGSGFTPSFYYQS